MKSQTQKFNERYRKHAKMINDEHAIYAPQYEEPSEHFHREEEMTNAGNIEEAFAVFSRDGMGFFMQTLQESMKREVQQIAQGFAYEVITQVTPIIKEMVQKEIEIALLGAISGMRKGLQTHTQPTQQEELDNKVEKEKEETSVIHSYPSITSEEAETLSRHLTVEEMGKRIIEVLKQKKFLKIKDMVEIIPQIKSAPNYYFKKIMKACPEIINVKYGVYGLKK